MLAPLLAKLHVSPASTESLIHEVYEEVNLAVDDKKFNLDATGRNSLYKIHVSLGKIVNSLNEKDKDGTKEKGRGSRKSSIAPSVLTAAGDEEESDEKTELPVIKSVKEEEEEEEEEDTVVGGRRDTRDSLVEELLSDGGDVEMSGM